MVADGLLSHDEQLTALGLLVGALTFAPEDCGCVVNMKLSRTGEDDDPPRLFVRYPGKLDGTYRVTVTREPHDDP
jgi:hypothetical protein